MANRVLLGLIEAAGGGVGTDTFGLKVSKPGKNVLTETDGDGLSFHSQWLENSNVLVSGVATPGTTATGGYYPLVTFTTQTFIPNIWLFSKNAFYAAGVLDAYVTTNKIWVRAGNVYSGYSRPAYPISYVVFNSQIIGNDAGGSVGTG